MVGRDLGPEKFQFWFESEADLQAVLSEGPYHYKKWMLILQRWEPVLSDSFPSNISFWLRVHDLPLHFWNDDTMNAIGKELGYVADRKADDARVRVDMNGLLPLTMNLEIRLPSEDIITVEFEYLKIEKHCFVCFSLFHEEMDCPSKPRYLPPPKERKLGITKRIAFQRIEVEKKRHDDRRGYTRHQPNARQYRSSTEDRERQSLSHNQSYAGGSPRRSQNRHYVAKDRNTTSGYERHRRQSPRDHPPSQTDNCRRELSSGKLVSNNKSLASNGLMVDPLGANTSIDAGSHNSRTPPSRQLRERLEFPQELSSERTLTTSRERRSTLERITEPDLRDTLPLSLSQRSNSGKRKEMSSQPDTISPLDHRRLKSGKEGPSVAPRAPASLRLQEPSAHSGEVRITIPPSQNKAEGKRRVTKVQRRVARSPLKTLKALKLRENYSVKITYPSPQEKRQ